MYKISQYYVAASNLFNFRQTYNVIDLYYNQRFSVNINLKRYWYLIVSVRSTI